MIVLSLSLALLSADRFTVIPPAPLLVVVRARDGGISSAEVLQAAAEAFEVAAWVAVVSPEQVGLFSAGHVFCGAFRQALRVQLPAFQNAPLFVGGQSRLFQHINRMVEVPLRVRDKVFDMGLHGEHCAFLRFPNV